MRIEQISIILYILISQFLRTNSQSLDMNCNYFSPYNAQCLECKPNYILDDNHNCKFQLCEDFLYQNNDLQQCSSTCPNDQIGDLETQFCQKQNICPEMIDAGQIFHLGSVSSIILINYIDDKNKSQNDLLSFSNSDNSMFIWDAETGQIKTKFNGHTQPIIKIAFNKIGQDMITFSTNGEVFVWNYMRGRINKKLQLNINGAQLTEQSQVDLKTQKITMFGFQGQFYLVDYISSDKISFYIHTKVVYNVLFLLNNYLISYGYDGQIILWLIKDPEHYKIINSSDYCPKNLDYLLMDQIQQNIQTIVIIYFGNIENTIQASNCLHFIELNLMLEFEELNKLDLKNNMKSYQIDLSFKIIDFIIDITNQQIITYSSSQISILSYNINDQIFKIIYSAQLDNQKLDQFIINNLYLSQDIIVMADITGHIITFNYVKDPILQSFIIQPFQEEYNISFQLKRSGVRGIKLTEDLKTLFIFGDQIARFNIQNREIEYIITKFQPSQKKHSKQVNSLYQSIVRQIICSVGDDGLIFIYNYLDGSLLNVLSHPNYTLETTISSGLKAEEVTIVKDSMICASFSDKSVVCYIPPNGYKYFIFQMSQEIYQIRKDDALNYLLIFLLDSVYIFNLNDGKIVQSQEKIGAFYQTRFIAAKLWLSSYSKFGSQYVWEYPSLALLYYADNSLYNPENAIINQQNGVNDNEINFVYYASGLLIIRNYNLTFYKSIKYSDGLNQCGLQYPFYIWCGTQNGMLVGFEILKEGIIEKKLYNFPIIEGKFTSTVDITFILIDYGSYGSGLQIGNVQNMLADQAFSTPTKILDLRVDETYQRVYVGETSGVSQSFSYIKKTNKVVLNSETSNINKIIPIEIEYKFIVLSNQITIKNYFSITLYKSNTDHVKPVKDALLDINKQLIISISDDKVKNLHYWFYKEDKSNFLYGHKSSVQKVIIDYNSQFILSSDSDGVIIIWNYQLLQIQKIIPQLHNNKRILNMIQITNSSFFNSPTQQNDQNTSTSYIITQGLDNTICIYNYLSDKIISRINILPNSGLEVDNDYNRIFVTNNNIKVYSTLTGLKITELQGMDGESCQIIIQQDIILVFGILNIVTFDRSSLNFKSSGRSTFPIYKGVVIDYLFAFISNSTDNIIKLFNYNTGTMLPDMLNLYYPDNIREIYIDQTAKFLIAINVKNYLFIYNPFIDAISKIIHYLLLSNPPPSTLNKLQIDYQNNIMIVYSVTDIVFWNYYIYIGLQGQRMLLSSDPQINYSYLPQNDTILFFDKEQNVWSFKDNVLKYEKYLTYLADFVIQKNGLVIVGQQDYLIVYNSDLNEIQRLKIGPVNCYNNENIPYLFIVCDDFSITQIEIKESQEFIIVKNYQLNPISRIIGAVFNLEYSHFLLYDILGKLVVIDFIQQQILFTFTNHTGPIRQLQFNNNAKLQLSIFFSIIIYNQYYLQLQKNIRLLTCSDDKTIKVYSYESKNIAIQQTIQQPGFVLEMILDVEQNRLFCWSNLSQGIKVLNIQNKFVELKSILAPGNTKVNIIKQEKYNLLIIHNLFQINFHAYDDLHFLFSLRSPYLINDISEVKALNNKAILILACDGLWLAYYSNNSIKLDKQFKMYFSQIISVNFENNLINIKGINQQTIFNYTMIEDNNLSYSSCTKILDNPVSYFNLQSEFYLEQLSVKKSQLKLKDISYIIKIQNDSSFYPQSQDIMNQLDTKISLKYYCADKYQNNNQQDKNILFLYDSVEDYDLQSLTIENCSLFIMLNQKYYFHPNTKNFTFTNLSYYKTSTQSTSIIIQNINQFISDHVSIEKSIFNGIELPIQEDGRADSEPNILFFIQQAELAYLNEIRLINCTIQDTIFYQFKEVKKVIIKNLILKDIKFVSKTQFKNLFEFKNIESLTIENVEIANVTIEGFFIIFNLEGIFFTHIKNITMIDSNNCSLLQYSKEFQEEKYKKTVKEDYLIIENVNLYQLNSFIPLISIESDYLYLNNLNATQNTCVSCDGTVLNLMSTFFQISKCIFQGNQGYYGGSIYIENSKKSSKISETTLFQNTAHSGGGIYLNESDLILEKCQIQYNSALIGGGIRYIKVIPDFIAKKNLYFNDITNNSADIFGQNIASYPQDIRISKSNQSDSFIIEKVEGVYNVHNFRSGEYLKLLIQFVDEENNIIKLSDLPFQKAQEVDEYSVQFSTQGEAQIIGQSFLTLDNFNTQSQGFLLNQMIVTAEPENIQSIIVLSSSLQIPNYQYNIFVQNQFYSIINIQFRPCLKGEIYIPKSQVQNAFCQPCPQGQYSLSDPKSEKYMSCINCPDSALKCEGKNIQLKNGYWREDNETDLIIECINKRENCIAESKESKNYCKEGFMGPLCETCDSAGEVWDDNYVSIDKKKNINCIKKNEILLWMAQYIAILLAVLIYITFAMYKTFQNAHKNLYSYYLRLLGLASFGNSVQTDIISVQIKLLMHFFYISSIIQNTFKMKIPMDYFFQSVSSPIQSFQVSQMTFSLLKREKERENIYKQQIIIQFMPLILMICCYLLLTLITYKKNDMNRRSTFINTTIFIFIFFQPDTLASILSIIQCRTIGLKKYIAADLMQLCFNSNHIQFMGFFTLPMFIVWSILIPAMLLNSLKKQKNNLFSCQPTIRYGFLYKEYKRDQYYWEFIKMNSRFIIIIFNVILYEKTLLSNQLTCLVLLLYYVLLSSYQPYKNPKFNKQDQFSHIILIVVYILHTISLSDQTSKDMQSIIQLFIISINYTYLIYLFWSIISSKLILILYKLLLIFPTFYSKLQQFRICQSLFKKCIQQQNNNLMQVFERQRRLRLLVIELGKLRRRIPEQDQQVSQSSNIVQLVSQSSIIQNSMIFTNCLLQNKNQQNSASPLTPNTFIEDDQKMKSYSNIFTPGIISPKKCQQQELLQNSIQGNDLNTSNTQFAIGSHFSKYINNNSASKSVFLQKNPFNKNKK